MNNTEQQEERQAQVTTEINELMSHTERLEMMTAKLCGRLHPVLRQEGPKTTSQPEQEELVPLAHVIREIRGKVDDVSTCIQDIITLLEI